MENISDMGKNSLESVYKDNLSEPGRKRLTVEIVSGAITLTCLAVGLIYTYVLKNKYPIVPELLYFIGFLIEGIPVIVTGIKGVFSKDLKNAMEMLVAIAIVACVFNRELILALLIPLILNVVHILEERSIMGGKDVIEGLKKMQQSTAVLIDGDKEITVDAKSLKVGQKIVVKAGVGIPVDGTVVSGKTNVDQKSLTGEPQPAFVKEGDSVFAGTVNLDGKIIVQVEKEYVDTSFSKILKLLEKSEGISVAEAGIMDKFLGYYIPFVLGIAVIVAIISRDISKLVAVLVVSCPCGQMLVSSAPMIAALSVSTKRGILIKNSKFVEELTEIDTVVFDKTGTVTKGELSVTDVVCFDGVDKDLLLKEAASLAHASAHPASKALCKYVEDMNLEFCKDLEVNEESGMGVKGVYKNTKETVLFGRFEWIKDFGCETDGISVDGEKETASYLCKNGKLLGKICFNDTIREDAQKSIENLKELGVERTVMLTGDREKPASDICKSAGIDEYYAKLLPQDKMAKIRELAKGESNVLAVGDGINDALALREANVGIAMGAMGSDLAIESADIALMNNNLLNIPLVIKLAKRTRKIIYQNMAMSILISLTMIGLSAFGIISPLAGSLLHNVGAFSVLVNSSRIIKFDAQQNK